MLNVLTYSGIMLEITPQGTVYVTVTDGHIYVPLICGDCAGPHKKRIGTLRGVSLHPWRSQIPEFTLQECYLCPEVMTRAYLLMNQELPVWLQSKVKAGWIA